MYQVQSRDSWSYSNGTSESSCLPELGCVHGSLSFLHLDTYFSTSPPAVGRILFQCRTPNPDLRMSKLGIRVLTQMVLLKDLGTWYFACLAGTWYIVLDTKTYLYLVHCTSYFVQKKEADRKISLFFRRGFD